jgi:hypothetical protein
MGCGCGGESPPTGEGSSGRGPIVVLNLADAASTDSTGLPRPPGFDPPTARTDVLTTPDSFLGGDGIDVSGMAGPLAAAAAASGCGGGGDGGCSCQEVERSCCCRDDNMEDMPIAHPGHPAPAPDPTPMPMPNPGGDDEPVVPPPPGGSGYKTILDVPDVPRPPGFKPPTAQTRDLTLPDTIARSGRVDVSAMAGPRRAQSAGGSHEGNGDAKGCTCPDGQRPRCCCCCCADEEGGQSSGAPSGGAPAGGPAGEIPEYSRRPWGAGDDMYGIPMSTGGGTRYGDETYCPDGNKKNWYISLYDDHKLYWGCPEQLGHQPVSANDLWNLGLGHGLVTPSPYTEAETPSGDSFYECAKKRGKWQNVPYVSPPWICGTKLPGLEPQGRGPWSDWRESEYVYIDVAANEGPSLRTPEPPPAPCGYQYTGVVSGQPSDGRCNRDIPVTNWVFQYWKIQPGKTPPDYGNKYGEWFNQRIQQTHEPLIQPPYQAEEGAESPSVPSPLPPPLVVITPGDGDGDVDGGDGDDTIGGNDTADKPMRLAEFEKRYHEDRTNQFPYMVGPSIAIAYKNYLRWKACKRMATVRLAIWLIKPQSDPNQQTPPLGGTRFTEFSYQVTNQIKRAQDLWKPLCVNFEIDGPLVCEVPQSVFNEFRGEPDYGGAFCVQNVEQGRAVIGSDGLWKLRQSHCKSTKAVINVYYVGTLYLRRIGINGFDQLERGLGYPMSADNVFYKRTENEMKGDYPGPIVFIGDNAGINTLGHELGHVFGLNGFQDEEQRSRPMNVMNEPTLDANWMWDDDQLATIWKSKAFQTFAS